MNSIRLARFLARSAALILIPLTFLGVLSFMAHGASQSLLIASLGASAALTARYQSRLALEPIRRTGSRAVASLLCLAAAFACAARAATMLWG